MIPPRRGSPSRNPTSPILRSAHTHTPHTHTYILACKHTYRYSHACIHTYGGRMLFPLAVEHSRVSARFFASPFLWCDPATGEAIESSTTVPAVCCPPLSAPISLQAAASRGLRCGVFLGFSLSRVSPRVSSRRDSREKSSHSDSARISRNSLAGPTSLRFPDG